jgi:hypothetical protein
MVHRRSFNSQKTAFTPLVDPIEDSSSSLSPIPKTLGSYSLLKLKVFGPVRAKDSLLAARLKKMV